MLRSRVGRTELLRSALIELASLFANYRSPFSGPRVQIRYMREGGVGVALSVLYSFFDEADVFRGRAPHPDYPETLEKQLEKIDYHVRHEHGGVARIARNPAELAAARKACELALIHCVEGGFHLGATPAQVRRSVKHLAQSGVAYITLAHLIWRGVATDAPALPFLTDEQYRCCLPQPTKGPNKGLSKLGRAAVEAMVKERVLIDLSHMSEDSLKETFDLLDALDKKKSVPVLATHTGCRFNAPQEYLLQPKTIKRIADRNGVIGLIFAQHQLYEAVDAGALRRHGLRVRKRKRFEESFEVICRHIDRIKKLTGSHRHVAIGSDFDGFIKPTLAGLQDMRDMAVLERALKKEYKGDAALICSENALRPLTSYWRGGP